MKQCQKAELQVAEVFRRDGGEEHRTDDGVHVKNDAHQDNDAADGRNRHKQRVDDPS
ncbi:hypothetical protein EMIT013CA1_120049 [Bacillus sp. IT-13CA1]